MKLTEFIPRKAIIADLKVKDKKAAVTALVKAVKSAGYAKLSVTDVVQAVMQREKSGSTGIGGGVALPHAKTNLIPRVLCAIGRCKKGVPFDAVDGESVTSIFLILAPEKDDAKYHEALQVVATAIKRPNFLSFLKQAKDVKDIEDILKENESALTV